MEHLWGSQIMNPDSHESESESLLKSRRKKLKKNKHDKIKSPENIQSQSFLNGLSTSFLTCDLESSDSDKRKKRKINGTANSKSAKKNRKNSVDFQTQNSSLDFVGNTPESSIVVTPKTEKHKHKKVDGESPNGLSKSIDSNTPVGSILVTPKKDKYKDKYEKMNGESPNGLNKSMDSSDPFLNYTSNFFCGTPKQHAEFGSPELLRKTANVRNFSDDSEISPVKHRKKKHSIKEEYQKLNSFNDMSLSEVEVDIKPSPAPSPDFPFEESPVIKTEERNEESPAIIKEKRNKKFLEKKDIESSCNDSKFGLYSPSQSLDSFKSGSAVEEASQDSSKVTTVGKGVQSIGSPVSDKLKEDDDFKKFIASLQRPFEIDFEIPRLHRVLNRASKPTPEQRGCLASEGIDPKYGKYTRAEDKQIMANWNDFLEVNNLKAKPEYFFYLDKKYIPPDAKRSFLYFLARNLPERTPYSVFRRFKVLTRTAKIGRFTKEELACIHKATKGKDLYQTPIAHTARLLNREKHSVDKRIRTNRTSHYRRIKWKSKKNIVAFIKYLLKVTQTPEENLKQLRHRHITREEWSKLSQKLDDVPVDILQRVWLNQVYPALFISNKWRDLRNVKIKLIDMFHSNGETDWAAVNWKEYASHFKGFTNIKIHKLMKNLVQNHVPKEKRHNLKKCLKVLTKLDPNKFKSKIMSKIVYKNGKIDELSELSEELSI